MRQFEAMIDSMTHSLELAGDWIASGKVFFIDHGGQTWWCGSRAMEGANRNV